MSTERNPPFTEGWYRGTHGARSQHYFRRYGASRAVAICREDRTVQIASLQWSDMPRCLSCRKLVQI